MSSRQALIQWYLDREGKVSYSKEDRLGPNSYDSGSALFSALIAGKFLPEGSELADVEFLEKLEGVMIQQIPRLDIQAGDIFIKGFRLDGSLKASAYCGLVLSPGELIACRQASQGIGRNSSLWMVPTTVRWYRLMEPTATHWRPKGFKKAYGLYANGLNYDLSKDNSL